jgi:L-rhamnonate dehydratase
LRITDIAAIPITIPYKEAIVSSFRGRQEGCRSILVRVSTDEGVVGWGETVGQPPWNDISQAMIEKHIRPVLLGHDPRRVELLTRRMEAVTTYWDWAAGSFAVSAVETALWDIKGKVLGAPIYELMGGLVTRTIPVTGYVFIDTPEENVRLAKRYMALGIGGLKVKVGRDPESDEARVAALREALGPAGIIRVDADGAWSAKKAIQVIKRLEPYGLALAEQPVPVHDHAGLKLVRHAVDVPVAPDGPIRILEDVVRYIRDESCDALVLRPEQTGGLQRFRHIAAVAEAAGLSCACGSAGSSGVLFMARFQAVASCSNFPYPSDSHYSYLADDVIEGGALEIRDGAFTVPDGPGLGIEVDEDKVRAFAEAHVETTAWTSDTYLPRAPRHWF